VLGTPTSITVVIPVWDDYVRFLPDAIRSVRRDAPDAPIVIVDNASIRSVPAGDDHATLVRSPERLSVGAARNLGIDQVETEFVIVLDADDMLLPGAIEFLSSRITANPGLSVCATSILDAETGKRHRTPRRFVLWFSRLRRSFAFADSVWSLLPIQGCAIMRTEQIRDAGGYPDVNWGDDWVLAISLAFRGRVEVHQRLGRHYRVTPDSLWRRPRDRAELVASAQHVRDRVRNDAGIPSWARALLPLLKLLQLAAIYVLRPVYRWTRRLTGKPE
jgi:glycosyltransferase involved in cell wall biosynthesis